MIDNPIPFDINTISLFKELKNDYNISFETWDNNFAEVFTQNNNAIISFNPKKATPACIAHELLHIWLKQFNYVSTNYMRLVLESHPFLSQVFDVELTEHIGNCMDHNKMYPKFREMGYSPENFFRNGGMPQCSINDVRSIYLKVNGKYSPVGVNNFIGHLISILADHCDNNYDKQLNMLQKRDQVLFNIVSNFWNKWTEFDIENIDVIYNSDIELIDRYITAMEEWCLTKGIIHYD